MGLVPVLSEYLCSVFKRERLGLQLQFDEGRFFARETRFFYAEPPWWIHFEVLDLNLPIKRHGLSNTTGSVGSWAKESSFPRKVAVRLT